MAAANSSAVAATATELAFNVWLWLRLLLNTHQPSVESCLLVLEEPGTFGRIADPLCQWSTLTCGFFSTIAMNDEATTDS